LLSRASAAGRGRNDAEGGGFRANTVGDPGNWISERLATGALNLERPGADLIALAYSGLRWGELAALTIAQVDPATRVIAVDRKVAGHLYLEAPKNRKRRRTIYPRTTPAGYPAGRPARAGPRRAGRRRHHRHR
jgi:integrase